jgi:hypothetical protein
MSNTSNYGCFISGLPQTLKKRPILRGQTTAFDVFPSDNNWVAQLQKIEHNSPVAENICVAPKIKYQCANKNTCVLNSHFSGNIAPVSQTPSYTLNYPQVNQCSTSVSYRQILDSRRGCQ